MQTAPGSYGLVTENTPTQLPVFTIECWIRAEQRLVIAARDRPLAVPSDWCLVYNWDMQCLEFVTQVDAGKDLYIYSTSFSLTPHEWNHVAIVVNGPAGTIRGYTNCELTLRGNFSPRYFDVIVPLSWGAFVPGGQSGHAIFDECRYWNVERTTQQILDAQSEALSPGDRIGLVGYWQFSNSFADSSGNGNHIYPIGSPAFIPVAAWPFPSCCTNYLPVPPRIVPEGRNVLCPNVSMTLTTETRYTSYRWNTGSAEDKITIQQPGWYWVIVDDGVHCPDTAWYEAKNKIVKPRITGPSILCSRDTAILSTEPEYALYEWSTGETTSEIRITSPGMYSVRVIDIDGCEGVDTVFVQYKPAEVSISGPRHLCPGDTAELIADPGFLQYRWSGGERTQRIHVTQPGRYIVSVIGENGCTGEDTLDLSGGEAGVRIAASPRTTACRGDSVRLVVDARFSAVRWSTGDRTNSIFVRSGGRYFVAAEDSFGCASSDSITIRFTDPPRAAIRGPVELCEGESAVLSAEGTFAAMHWSTGDTSRSITVNRAGRYTLSVRDSNGCASEATHDIAVLPAPVPTITGRRTLCVGESLVLDAGGGYASYRWSTGADTRSIVLRTPGVYIVTVTTALGCTGSDTARVTNAISAYIHGNTTLCGDSTRLTAMPGGGVYRWSSGDTTQSITARTAGTYNVTVTDTSGCSAVVEVTVRLGAALHPEILGDRILCQGDTGVLATVESFDTWRWSTGDSTQSIMITKPGLYAVSVTRAGYCPGSSDTVRVRFSAKPEPRISGAVIVCRGDTTVYSTQAFPGRSYVWTATGGRAIGNAEFNPVKIVWDSAGTGTLRLVEVDDSSGCSDSTYMTVQSRTSPIPEILADGPLVFCEGDSVVLDAGAGYALYRWSDGQDTRRIVARTTGVYSVAVRDSFGCSGESRRVEVIVIPRPQPAVSGPRAVCINTKAMYSCGTVAGVTVRWQVQGGTPASADTAQPFEVHWFAPGTGRVIVTASRDGCERTDTMLVSVGTTLSPEIVASGPLDFCTGDSVQLDAGAAYKLTTWTDSSGRVIGTMRRLSVRRGGQYTVSVSDSTGCSGSAFVHLYEHPTPGPVVEGPHDFCEGDSVQLSCAVPYMMIQWFKDGVLLKDGALVQATAPGDYSITVIDSNGCSGTSTSHPLLMHPRPSMPRVTRSGDTLISTSARQYQWYFGSALLPGETDQHLVAQMDGWYSVRVMDEHGCSAQSPPFEFKRGARAHVVVSLPALSARPGERVVVPLLLDPAAALHGMGTAAYSSTLRFDGRLLVPVESTPAGFLEGVERRIPLDERPAAAGPVLDSLVFIATLGPTARTLLHLERFDFHDPRIAVSTIDGEFRLVLCEEGGARLFDGSARSALRQNRPNPFNTETVIEYEIAERGPTNISVIDLLGRTVAVLVDQHVEPGHHRVRFDASALSSGLYYYTLRTVSQNFSRILIVSK